MAATCSIYGFPRLFGGKKCSFRCFKSIGKSSLRMKETYKHCAHYRTCSTFQNANSKDEDTYSKFEKMMRERRRQIEKSILVHVYSKHVIVKLYNHCQKYGRISRAFHYTLENDKDFALIEFENNADVQKLLSDTRHFDRDNVIPVHSRCLWYHEVEQGKEASLPAEFTTSYRPTEENILNALQKSESVSEQMTSLHEMLQLSELGQLLRFFICHQMELAFSGLFTNCTVLPFGSSVNGFGKNNCDLDMVLSLGEKTTSTNNGSKLFFHTKHSLANGRVQVQRHLETMSDIISNFFPGCSNIQRILQARVPIVKFSHELVNAECDLTMNNLSGVYMSELLYLYGESDSRVRPLVFSVLRWAKHSGLTQDVPGRWITNFSLILMVIVFLQSRPNPILPSLEGLRKLSSKAHQRSSEGVDCSFLRDISKFPKMKNDQKQGDLLHEFFNHYANFDFKNRGLSLNAGFDVLKPDYSALYIQNPFETELNVCKNVNTDELARIQQHFESALWKLESSGEPIAGNLWGLLALFNARQGGESLAGKSKRYPVSALFDKSSFGNGKVQKKSEKSNVQQKGLG